MTQNYINYTTVFLQTTLFLLAIQSNPVEMLQLDPNVTEPYCKESNTPTDDEFEISCGLNSTILAKIYGYNNNRISELHYNCYNGNPLNISALLNKTFVDVTLVKINSCRFAANESLATFLRDTLWNSKIGTIAFCNDQDDLNTLERTKEIIRGIDNFVGRLSFTILNASILPLDLFANVKNLKALTIITKSSNSSHLSGLLAPLKYLSAITLITNNLQEIPESIFANNKILQKLELSGSNVSLLPSDFFSNLSNLETIYLGESSFPCNDSATKQDYRLSCSRKSEIIVQSNVDNLDLIPEINFICFNAKPLKIIALLNIAFKKNVIVVRFINCRFSIKENIAKFLNDTVGSYKIESIEFYIDRIDNSLSHANIRGIDKLVDGLSFVITNISALPTNLFADLKKLKILSISSNSIDSSHLSAVLALLEDLEDMYLKTDNLQEISGSIFTNNTFLRKLELSGNSVTSLPSNFFTNLSSLESINLRNTESRITVQINDEIISEINFDCYNAEPLKITALQSKTLEKYITAVRFKFCRFPTNESILKLFNDYVGSYKINRIEFYIEQIDYSPSRANLKGIDKFIPELFFIISNVSILPTDLFYDIGNLKRLSVYSYSVNLPHLSDLIAPLEDLYFMSLKTDNVEDISGNIFTHPLDLQELYLDLNNITALPTDLFSHLINLEYVFLCGSSFKTYKFELVLDTFLKMCEPTENPVALKTLPEGLFRHLLHLKSIEINNYQLESIPFDTFVNSTNIKSISIRGTYIHEMPLTVFADQKTLVYLDLSNNMLGTLIEGLFDCNKELEALNLSSNQLTQIADDLFKPLRKLIHLELNNNKLLTISSNFNQPQLSYASVFDNLKNLLTLKMKNNLINRIPYNILINAENLKDLDLSFNKINSIDCNFVTDFGSKINISDNPITCDCKSLCLHQHMNENLIQNNIVLKTIRCESPHSFKGKLLYELKLSNLLCFPDNQQGNASNRCTFNIQTPNKVLVMNCSGGNFNDIPTPPMHDQSFSNGIELFMDTNPLTELSSNALENITLFSIYDSPVTKLPEKFLSNLPKLRTVSLILPLEEIFVNIFDGSTAIRKLKLSGTNLEQFPGYLFYSQINLIDLDLSINKLRRVIRLDFISEANLRTLRLSHNVLESLSKLMFYQLGNLKKLFLDNNRLQHIDPDLFYYARSLEYITMENNQLSTIEPFFKLFGTLQNLILTNNSIENNHVIEIHQLEPSFLDVSLYNMCCTELSHLDSSSFNKTFLNFTNTNIRTITNGNISLKCDCRINTFVNENNTKTMYESLRCLAPGSIKPRNILSEELICPLKTICPDGCLCWIRPSNSTLIVNCSNASLTEVPKLPELKTIFQNGIELSIDHNHLTSLRPNSPSAYKGVTKLFAAYNQIINISSGDISEKMTNLDVSHNRIRRLDDQVIKVINESQTLRTIVLYANPIVCDCSSKNLTDFISLKNELFSGIDQCEDGRKFKTLFYTEICSIESINVEKVVSIVLVIIFFALFLVTTLYFNNKERILVWIYAHNLCRCLVTEEEVDKDMQFDAFVSYSSWDAVFVEKLVTKLENGPKPYKLCLHDRNWLAGGYIPDQIEKSVDVSRRTLIVMTEKYLTSKWTRYEFMIAHNASMNERRIRVIVILVGDIDIEGLDADLKKYVKMYTYLRWDDPWFWQKLGYALPHPSKNNQSNKQHNNLEMVQYCDAVDDRS